MIVTTYLSRQVFHPYPQTAPVVAVGNVEIYLSNISKQTTYADMDLEVFVEIDLSDRRSKIR
jgi:hypothetical protein